VFTPVYGLISFAVNYGVLIVFMYKGAISYKNSLENKEISYYNSFIVLLLISIPIYYISALFTFFINTVIDPNYHILQFQQFKEYFYSNNNKLSESFVKELIEATEKNLNPYVQLKNSITTSPFMAILLSSLMAFFIRTKKTD
jgi:hypothetical protein